MPRRISGRRELHVVGGHAEVARQRELEPDAERVAAELARSTGFGQRSGAATFQRSRDSSSGVALEEARDVAAGA